MNIFGIVPYQHLFWKGDLPALKSTLEKIGLQVNIIFTEFEGLENLLKIPSAELNLVLSPWHGVRTARMLQEKFGTPYLVFPGVPVGPKQTSELLHILGKRLDLSLELVASVIETEEKKVYRYMEYLGDALIIGLPHPYMAVVGDSATAISITKFLANEMGFLAETVIIVDDPPEEYRSQIQKELKDSIKSVFKPDVIFESDSHRIRQKLTGRSFLVLLASSLERYIAPDLGAAIHLSVSFPSYDRLLLERSYAGFHGGIALMEDIIGKRSGPL